MSKSKFTPQIAYDSVRDYQQHALDSTIDYIENFDTRKGTSHLVAMPTGSGKTAIMALLARCYGPMEGIVLIVSPRIAVSKQLAKEIGGSFFTNKLNLTDTIPKTVAYYNERFKLTGDMSGLVLIATIQKIDFYRKAQTPQYREEYESLLRQVKLLIFDEGHYEPALSWSSAIRQFRCPRIIFTATPFRNDLKNFDINWDSAFIKSYQQILKAGFLRKVVLKNVIKPNNSRAFLEDVIQKYNANFPYENGKNSKIIINCENAKSIIDLSEHLVDMNISFIAIHERFDGKFRKTARYAKLKGHMLQNVPEHPENLESIVWIHQYKLLEGIDDSSFRMLAIYEPLRSTRALIQQIGRIIRNPTKNKDKAFVYNYTEGSIKEDWDRYLQLSSEGGFEENFSQMVHSTLDHGLRNLTYFEKKFREKLNKESFESWNLDELKKHINLPLKVNLFKKMAHFDLDRVAKGCLESRFLDEEYIYYKNQINQTTILYYYFNISNSDFLSKTYFPSISQDVCLIKDMGNYIAFYDSSNFDPSGNDAFSIGLALDPSMLFRLFEGDDVKFNRVSLKNGNIGSKDIRNHSFSAPSIAETTPFLNDYSHFIGSTFGSFKAHRIYKESYQNWKKADSNQKESRISTYIGFSKGRISQSDFDFVTIRDYLGWLEYLDATISSKDKELNAFFNRYAFQISDLDDKQKIPANILIDLVDLDGDIFISTGKTTQDEGTIPLTEAIQDSCKNINPHYGSEKKETKIKSYSFWLTIGTDKKQVFVRFDIKTKKYLLECPDISSLKLVSSRGTELSIDLISYLNKKQCFRILTTQRLIYAHGHFYNPGLPFGAKFDESKFPLINIMHSIAELGNISSEKGVSSTADKLGWEEETLFSLIDNTANGRSDIDAGFSKFLIKPDILICDDLGTEIADFVAVYREKLIFMHVKGNGNDKSKPARKYSATSLGEVCNQAIKNIHFLSIFDSSKPKHLERWLYPYSVTNIKYGIDIKVESRIRVFEGAHPSEAEELWKEIEKVKFNGSSQKEVWIILGRLFSKSAFIKQLKASKPAPEAIQAALTLQNAMASVSSIGAKLSIFCSP